MMSDIEIVPFGDFNGPTLTRKQLYFKGREDMQNEIIGKLGSYEANKCAQIAASVPVDKSLAR